YQSRTRRPWPQIRRLLLRYFGWTRCLSHYATTHASRNSLPPPRQNRFAITADVCCRGGYSLKEFLMTPFYRVMAIDKTGLDEIIPYDITEQFHFSFDLEIHT